jgi:ATP-dependent Clp protease protease subunit
MNIKKEFEKYAVKHLRMNALALNDYAQSIDDTANKLKMGMTPTVIEERRMNISQMDVFSRLMMDRIIFLGMGIDDYVANVIQAQLLFLESVDAQRDVQIFINCPGGSVTAGLGIYDTMNYIRPDVATVCTGLAASFGTVILTSGAKGKRSCLPHSRIMIHQPSGGSQGQLSDMEITYQLFKELQKDLYTILSNQTGQTYEQIALDCDRDNWMRAEAAKEYGLIDEVLRTGVIG